MKSNFRYVNLALFLLSAAAIANGCAKMNTSTPVAPAATDINGAAAANATREDFAKAIPNLEPSQEKARRAVSLEELSEYSDYGPSATSGIVRLSRPDSCNTGDGCGAYFTFSDQSQAKSATFDIMYDGTNLVANTNSPSLGFLSGPEKTSLSNVSAASDIAKTAIAFKAPTTASNDTTAAASALLGGTLTTSAAPSEGMTYVLRSVNYGQSDLVVALRVVKQEAAAPSNDGSLVVIWKILKDNGSPSLAAGK